MNINQLKIKIEYSPFGDMLCPMCGAPPDYCIDHSHWRCPECDDILDIKPNNEADEWECPTCPPQ